MRHRQEVREKNCCSENYLSNRFSYLNWEAFILFSLLLLSYSIFPVNTVQKQTAISIAAFVIALFIKPTVSLGYLFVEMIQSQQKMLFKVTSKVIKH